MLVGAAVAATVIKSRRRIELDSDKAHPLSGVVQKRATMFSNLADKAGRSKVARVEMTDTGGGEFV